MRSFMLTLLGSSLLLVPMAGAQQGGAADLCQELRAYAEKKAAEPPKEDKAGQAAGKAEDTRSASQGSGTQGGGSTNRSTSSDTSSQSAAPPTGPVSSGAASEAASSAHATSAAGDATGSALAGGLSVQQVLATTGRGDRQACRETAQTLRRAGADLPAALIALAAYEPKGRN